MARPDQVRSSHEIYSWEKMKEKECHEGRYQAIMMVKNKVSPYDNLFLKNRFDIPDKIGKDGNSLEKTSPDTIGKDGNFLEKTLPKKTFFDETYKIIRAMLLTLSISVLCYHGLRNGPTEYNILENGQIFSNFASPRNTVITFSLGYSVWVSIIYAVTAVMLVYSIVSKRPQFSLPLMILFFTELVCNFCDAIVISWFLFRNLQLQSALLYVAELLLLILTETWMWLGVLELYEYRNFSHP